MTPTKPLNAGEVVQGYTYNWPDCVDRYSNASVTVCEWDVPIQRDNGYTELAILTRTHYEALLAEVERLRVRLEIDRVYVLGDDRKTLVERKIAPGETPPPDGISCRDETIKLLDEQNADLRTRLSEAERDGARYRHIFEDDRFELQGPEFDAPDPSDPEIRTKARAVLSTDKEWADATLDAAILAQKDKSNG